MVITSPDSTVARSRTSLPRSAVEEYLDILVPQVELPVLDSTLSESGSYYYQLHQLSLSLFMSSINNTVSSNGTVFNSLSVKTPRSPCSAGDSCSVELTFPVSNSVSTSDATNETVIGQCADSIDGVLHLLCPSSEVLRVPCDDLTSEIRVTCPQAISKPSCAAIGIEDGACTLVSSNSHNITCSCPLQGSSRRSLSDTNDTTIGDSTISVSYVAMMSTTLSSFTSTIVSAQGLDVSVFKTGWQVIVTLGCFLGFVAGAIFFARTLDRQKGVAVKPSGDTKINLSGWRNVVSSLYAKMLGPKHAVHPKKHLGGMKASGLLSFAEEALPRILGSRSLNTKVKEELKHHHRWLAIVYTFSKRFPRMLRVLSLSTNIVIMLFVQSITYNLSHGDDGTCDEYHSEEQCLADKSAYETGASKCYWTVDDDSCHYVQPDSDIKVVIFVAILSAVISTPFAMLADWMIQTVLAAPTLIITGSNGKSNLDTEKRFSSVLPISDAMVVERRSNGGPTQLRRTSSSLRRSKIQRDELKEQLRLQSEKEFSQLVKALQMYRSSEWLANTEVKNEFDGKIKKVFCFLL